MIWFELQFYCFNNIFVIDNADYYLKSPNFRKTLMGKKKWILKHFWVKKYYFFLLILNNSFFAVISLWNDMFKTIEHRRVIYPQFSLCRGTFEKCLLDFYLSSVCVELVLLMFPGPQTGCFNVNLLFLSVLGQIHKNIHICFYVIFLSSCLFPCLSVALKMCK